MMDEVTLSVNRQVTERKPRAFTARFGLIKRRRMLSSRLQSHLMQIHLEKRCVNGRIVASF